MLHRSRTLPILLKYPAGSTCGSDARGISILGIIGGILLYPGVVGDLREEEREDCEIDMVSVTEPRLELEVLEEDGFSLRVKRPIV